MRDGAKPRDQTLWQVELWFEGNASLVDEGTFFWGVGKTFPGRRVGATRDAHGMCNIASASTSTFTKHTLPGIISLMMNDCDWKYLKVNEIV
jgi:hypothetical protein